jgi:hypothetical protein
MLRVLDTEIQPNVAFTVSSLLAILYKQVELRALARVYEIYLFIFNHTSHVQTQQQAAIIFT